MRTYFNHSISQNITYKLFEFVLSMNMLAEFYIYSQGPVNLLSVNTIIEVKFSLPLFYIEFPETNVYKKYLQ